MRLRIGRRTVRAHAPLALALAAALAWAAPAPGAFVQRVLTTDDILNGTVDDYGLKGSTVSIQFTMVDGTAIGIPHFKVVGASGKVSFDIPLDPLIDDVNQDISLPDPGHNSLRIEAFTVSGPDLIVTKITSAVFEVLGAASLLIPDLFADTNGNGMLDDGDHLYSAVNLYPYMAGNVSFNLGDSFNIVDGVSAALPGMVFGTSPISLDDTSSDGFDNPDPYTGPSSAMAMHGVTVPEPTALILLALGGLGLRIGRATPLNRPGRRPAARKGTSPAP
jgi:hypothetical protein